MLKAKYLAKIEQVQQGDQMPEYYKLLGYLMQELKCKTETEVHNKAQEWAMKDKVRYAKWEGLVRNGYVLKELQLFAKNILPYNQK